MCKPIFWCSEDDMRLILKVNGLGNRGNPVDNTVIITVALLAQKNLGKNGRKSLQKSYNNSNIISNRRTNSNFFVGCPDPGAHILYRKANPETTRTGQIVQYCTLHSKGNRVPLFATCSQPVPDSQTSGVQLSTSDSLRK